jgi:hypothetical protein|tara:strand:+ start:38 stop:1012 length:975 start_codon:yes stop_codon:yes gene_type:complete
MSGSGGSVSDAPTNKTVSGQRHHLAYITPDEVNTLVGQGGVPTMTNEGIMAYPPQGQSAQHGGTERSSTPSTDNSADRGGNVHRDTAQRSQPDTLRDTPDDVADTAGGYEDVGGILSRTNIEDIHGEWDDPDSESYNPTYNPVTQAKATKKSAFGSGKHSGAYIWDSKNQEYFRVTDYTWKEQFDRAPDILKWSPTLRSIYATGQNIGEWATRKGWNFDFKTGTVNDGQGNNVGERNLMNSAAVDAPYVASGTPTKSAPDSIAAQWFNQLGGTAGNFNLTSAFADAKAKQQQILGNTTPVGMLAANQTPYFDFLTKHNLTKGIL